MATRFVMSRLIVTDLPRDITDDAFEEHFKRFGDISFYKIARARDPERSHLGIIRFINPSSATSALIERHVILGTEVRVERPDYVSRSEIGRKIFVGGLPQDLTDGEFKEYFEQFGDLVDHVVIRYEDGCSKGFGFATFAGAESLLDVLRQRPHEIKGKTVDVKPAIPKQDMIGRGGGGSSRVALPGYSTHNNSMFQSGFSSYGSGSGSGSDSGSHRCCCYH